MKMVNPQPYLKLVEQLINAPVPLALIPRTLILKDKTFVLKRSYDIDSTDFIIAKLNCRDLTVGPDGLTWNHIAKVISQLNEESLPCLTVPKP
jgi:hypothetical protein